MVKQSVFCEAFPNGCGNPCCLRISIRRGISHSLSRESFLGRSQRTPIFEMGKIRRKFEPEFKRQMVEQVETGQVTMAQAAREYQISRSLIERWRKQYRSNVSALADQPSRQERQLEAENEKLKAKIGDLVIMESPENPGWFKFRTVYLTGKLPNRNQFFRLGGCAVPTY